MTGPGGSGGPAGAGEFAGLAALVTGGGSGIGLATAAGADHGLPAVWELRDA